MASPSPSDLLFGVPFMSHNGHWHMRPLMVLQRNGDILQRGEACTPNDYPRDHRVFWPPYLGHQDLRVSHPFYFQVSESRGWTSASPLDRYCVRGAQNDPWAWRFGSVILPQSAATGKLAAFQLKDDYWTGCTIYLHKKAGGGTLTGPWKVAEKGRLVPADTRMCVFEFAISKIDNYDLFDWENPWLGYRQEFLLNHPPEKDGKVVDLLPTAGLVDWFALHMQRLDMVGATDLNTRWPTWRDALKDQFDSKADSIESALDQMHWERVNELLDSLAGNQGAMNTLLAQPRFQEMVQAAINAEVQRLAGVIEERAKEEVEVRHQKLLTDITQLENRRSELEQSCTDQQRQVSELKTQIENRQEELYFALDDAARKMDESRGRLREELERIQSALGPVAPLLRRPVVGKILASPSANGVTQGDAIIDPVHFVKNRLLPILQQSIGAVPLTLASGFHLALLTYRWLLVPGPGWVEAYAEALGGTGRRLIVHVEVGWLTFRDAWTTEVSEFWKQAVADPDHIYLLTFHQINRSLPQLWAAGWLDILAGVRDTLPNETPFPWPLNLRVLATLADDPATFPLDNNVIAHWGGLHRMPVQSFPGVPNVLPGHLPAAIWLNWAASGLPGALRNLGDDGDIADWQRRLQTEWPREYLMGAAHG